MLRLVKAEERECSSKWTNREGEVGRRVSTSAGRLLWWPSSQKERHKKKKEKKIDGLAATTTKTGPTLICTDLNRRVVFALN